MDDDKIADAADRDVAGGSLWRRQNGTQSISHKRTELRLWREQRRAMTAVRAPPAAGR